MALPIVETMDEAGLKRHIDYYAVPGVTGILFNPNAMRAFFDSRAFEPLWKGMEEGDDGKARYQGRELEPAAAPRRTSPLSAATSKPCFRM